MGASLALAPGMQAASYFSDLTKSASRNLANLAQFTAGKTTNILKTLKEHKYKTLGAVSAIIAFNAYCRYTYTKKELRWDWDKIDTNKVKFPTNFRFGTATSEYQISGSETCKNSNWSEFEVAHNLERSGAACKGWDNAIADIALLKELGVSDYRFSVDWSRIEPQQGEFDEAALQHYVDLCDALLKEGITPMVTLHHFVHPSWFDKLGGFEVTENNKLFVRFCSKVFEKLGKRVPLWCTINEPTVYIFQGYMRGEFPPGESGIAGMKKAGRVLRNMLDAHIDVYQALKKLPGGEQAQIGFAHSYLQFEKFHTGTSPVKAVVEHSVAATLSSFLNDTTINYFTTGKFNFSVPGVVHEESFNHLAMRSLDWVGINYYAHVFLRLHHRLKDSLHPGYRPGDVATDMPYGMYAEGLYRAIQHMAQLKVPMYVTENGLADAKDDRRDLWIRRYIYAASRAVEDGYDLRGFYYWSLMNNFEWAEGYKMKFGLFDVDRTTQKRTLYKGSQAYVDTIKNVRQAQKKSK